VTGETGVRASKPPSVSVIVPVSDGRAVLPSSLGGLIASDLPRDRWELIVVDDGSGDGSAEIAAGWADRVVRIEGGPRGPAHARNRGAKEGKGDVLVFVDADVVVHSDTLSRFSHVFETRPDVDAVFGTYDDQPLDPGFLSQYRNLLHRYVHLRGAGEAESFWAGCGAVRRERFESLGGFDAARFPRPQIEDIELGYRIRAAGGKILLVPEIQATHLKRWTLLAIIRSDLLDRGIPWATLLFAGAGRGPGSRALNLGWVERVKTGLLGLALRVRWYPP
jgi:glycosyltransferase involved in cell wall biosynthesis